ncbi:intimin-like protein SinH [Candidatus Rubidus massiliensis]|nr:intimin-like protein SinH [Candidatus Rubidus massiliensis]
MKKARLLKISFFCLFAIKLSSFGFGLEIDNLFYINQTLGNEVGHINSHTSLGSFLIIPINDYNLTLIDTRGHSLYANRWAGNIGVGTRNFVSSDFYIGTNLFYDFRKDRRFFQQMGIGTELLSDYFNIRLNGYFPMGDKNQTSSTYRYYYPGNFFAKCKTQRRVLAGFDFSVEYNLKNLNIPYNIYTDIGYYYYKNKCNCKKINGIQLGLNAYLPFGINLEGGFSYDRVYKCNSYITIGFNFLFGSNTFFNGDNLYRPFKRRQIMIESKKYCDWFYNW